MDSVADPLARTAAATLVPRASPATAGLPGVAVDPEPACTAGPAGEGTGAGTTGGGAAATSAWHPRAQVTASPVAATADTALTTATTTIATNSRSSSALPRITAPVARPSDNRR
jgi:hypothetical protein